jgi:3-deoxy-7-phosphoheptulonate synthase
MVVIMQASALDAEIDAIVGRVTAAGGEAFVSRGESRTIIGLIGDLDRFADLGLEGLPGVLETVRISTPFKLVSRDHHPARSTVWVGRGQSRVPIGPGTLTVIAGPCAVETAEQTLAAATMAIRLGATVLRGGAFKPRTSPYAFQGLGRAGLQILADVRAETGLPIVTEVVDADDVDTVAAYADMLQVGTRNMANFALLQAVGAAGKPVLLKRGMSATIEEWLMAAEYIAQRGNLDVVLCERGIRTFETSTRNTLDISAIPVAQNLSHLPIVVDPSHSGGHRELVAPLSRAAVAAGADGLIIDVHPHPEAALVDGPQALTPEDLGDLASALQELAQVMGRTGTQAGDPSGAAVSPPTASQRP